MRGGRHGRQVPAERNSMDWVAPHREMTQGEFIKRLMRQTEVIVEANARSRTLRFSANPTTVEAALDLAAGAFPDIGWMWVGRFGFLAIGHGVKSRPMVCAFEVPTHTEFLVSIATYGSFTLDVEGTLPITLPVRKHDDALRPALRGMGLIP